MTRAPRFGILGPIVCDRAERLGPQQVRLLAVLLVNANRAVTVNELSDALWSTPATNRLQVAVVRLRKLLDGEPLQTVAGGYRLAVAPGELDADVFVDRLEAGLRALGDGRPETAAEVLRDALALWRGPALAEVAYDAFAEPEIRRLEGLRLTALEARIEAELELGRHAAVAAELEGLISRHPTRERFTRQLMLALYRCGRQTDALEVFQRARRRLDVEFGLTPGPALHALQARVLTHDPALDHAPISTALLLVAAGSRQERIVHLDARRQLTLGRDAGNDVELQWDGRVSRVHALLECIRGAWMLADDGLSSNGTFCNDRRVRRRRLKDGDVLRLGSTTLVFRDPNDRPRDRTAVEP